MNQDSLLPPFLVDDDVDPWGSIDRHLHRDENGTVFLCCPLMLKLSPPYLALIRGLAVTLGCPIAGFGTKVPIDCAAQTLS